MKWVVAAAGDPGGSIALLPVIECLRREGIPVAIVKHGFLGQNIPHVEERELYILPDSAAFVEEEFEKGRAGVYLFGTSIRDIFALSLARKARALGVSTVCMLDSWVNYRSRLEIDGLPTLYPDVYALMDETAFQGAIGEGLSGPFLKITGHPALSSLLPDWETWHSRKTQKPGCSERSRLEKRLIVFVSEPAEADQGENDESPAFRGYTEKTVLAMLCSALQEYADKVRLRILPHPREDALALKRFWERCRGALEGGLSEDNHARETIFKADGVCGMASILVYEAWLIGKPVLSLQPGLRQDQLFFLSNKKGCHFLAEEKLSQHKFSAWMEEVEGGIIDTSKRHLELDRHRKAPENVSRIIKEIMSLHKLGGPMKKTYRERL
ncbi:MAG: hypothetical protein GY849_18545 [Deltaproteobacteria bacterium]|nr:hypothetical protein [Deltaproteobacteria bacterium]